MAATEQRFAIPEPGPPVDLPWLPSPPPSPRFFVKADREDEHTALTEAPACIEEDLAESKERLNAS
jgi:hypothetical protein